MPRRFLRSLRGKALQPAEHKIVTGDYYGDLVSSGLWQPARARPWPVERAVAEGYERIVWVFKAVEAISANAARLPYRVKDGEDVLDDHPLYSVLNGRANPLETGREFRKRLVSQVLLSKRGAFVELTSSNGGDIVRMDLLPPGRTRPVAGREPGVLIDHYELTRADGSLRQIPPEKVRWFREPHPLDPFSGVTPLEAAGMSAELDYFGRLYNVSFLKNDGRPGGVLAINGEMDPNEMDRIEGRFKKGPTEAGNLTVINGEVSYVDLAARPRDVQYETLSKIAKNEILCAFGTPESILGYAADRSYSNAEQEQLNFWQVTMPPWLDLLATTLDGDSTDNLEGFFDTSKIEVLQRAEANRREEARKEFDLGLISANEYRDRAGYDDVDRPKARALWVASGKTVVATSDADAKAIDKEEMDKLPPEFVVNARNPAAATNNGLGKPAAAPGRGGAQPVNPLRPVPNAPRPTRAVNQPRGASGVAGGRAAAAKSHPAAQGPRLTLPAARSAAEPVMRLERPRHRKTAALSVAHGGGDSDADDAAHADLEEALEAALQAVGERLLQRALARLNSPKWRKGTRHWQPDAAFPADTRIGVKALDADRVVDSDRWGEEAEAAARPLLEDAADVAAAALLADLTAGTAAGAAGEAARRIPGVVAQITQMIGGAARRTAQLLAARSADAAAIADVVEGRAGPVRSAFAGVARQAATGLLAGAREGAAQAAADTDPGVQVTRMWRTRRDERVRDSHRAAHGQHQPVGSPFLVGGALLRFPGDPFGPPGEVYGCRCRLNYRVRATGRFTVTPAAEPAAAGS